MADIKVLYVNADSLNQEHSESADSIKMLSFKTANNELTDAKLGRLIDGTDAANEHIHDTRYFREDEHIDVSTGVSDAAKPVITDAAGKIDSSFIDVAELNPLLDHGALSGLGDDDHTIYVKADGTRNFTGIQSYTVHPSFTSDTQIVDKKYVDDLFAGDEWLNSADDRAITPPGSPTTGYRVLIDTALGTPTGAFAGHGNKVATWNGSVWTFEVPTAGTYISVDDEPSFLYVFDGLAWNPKAFENTTASTGLVKVGADIQIAPGAAGAGLGFSAGVLSVNVDNTTIEIATDTIQVKADGINDTHIDFGVGANQVNAADLPIVDAGNNFTALNVEDALSELYSQLAQQGVTYTVGVGGVTKGDLLYISGPDTVNKLSDITQNEYCIGVALETKSAAQTVKVLANDTVVQGVLTGASANDTVYWSGTGLVLTMPTGALKNIWQVGQAKNATDLHVEIRHIKKQSA